MDGFSASTNYTQFDPLSGPCAAGSCIPNLGRLATRYTISDRTFELDSSPSFEGHLAFAAGTQDGFYGDNPEDYRPDPNRSVTVEAGVRLRRHRLLVG